MKKTAIVAALFTLATAAHAGSIKLEAEGQLNKDKRESVKVEAWDAINSTTGLGFEAKTYLVEASKPTLPAYSELSGKVGFVLPKVGELVPVVKAEAGVKTGATTANFYGVSGELRYKPTDKVTTTVGYLYRDGFDNKFGHSQQKLTTGVSYSMSKDYSLGATYFGYKDKQNTSALALSVTRKF